MNSTKIPVLALACLLVSFWIPRMARAAEIYIDRRGQVQININNLNDGSSNNSHNDPLVSDFNYYIDRSDAKNPIEWFHQWDLATPSDGNIAIDGDEVYTTTLAAEMFAVIWDVDYPSSNEHDILFWDTVPYAGPVGAAFSNAANPAVVNLGRVQGNNNIWGAKRISMDPAAIGPGQTEYFWLQVDEDPGGTAWMSSIDYADLAIVFNEGKLAISKSLTLNSGFDPPRVGHTTYYLVRIDISNPTLTSTGGPVYDVKVTDKFATGTTIVTNPTLGSASIDANGNLTWNVGILQDGALNTPAAAGSTDFMVVRVAVTPAQADVGNPITLNTGATITGGQVPMDPGDGTGTLYPFNFFSSVSNQTNAVSVLLVTPQAVAPANSGAITATPAIEPAQSVVITVADVDLNVNPSAVEIVSVSVKNQTTNEIETITLTETGPNTGVFTANLATLPGAAAGANNSGSMNVKNGDVLRATYNEAADANGLPQTRTADTTVADNTNFVTITSPVGTFNTAVHDVIGTTDPYSTVTMTHPISGAPLSTTATASGSYTFSGIAFPEGTTTYTVTSTDPSNNVASAVATVKIDTTNAITMTSPGSGSTINTTVSDVSGLTNPNSTVTLVEPATGNTLTTNADGAGNYTFPSVAFNIGLNTLPFTSTDPAGNVATTTPSITVDPDIALNITSITDGATYTTAQHEVAGQTDPGATVTMMHPATGVTLTTTADGTGHYSFGSFPFSDGPNTVTTNATDPAGNSATATVSFRIDTTNNDTITTTGTFTVSYIDIHGTTDPLSTVTMAHPLSGVTYTAIADSSGSYVFEDIFFPDGTYTLSTVSTDPQGNTASDTSPINVVTSNAILVNLPADNSVVNASPLPVSGVTTPGATVTLIDPVSGVTYSQTAAADGSFLFPAVNLGPGANTITMVSLDPNGVSTSHTHHLFYDPNITLSILTPENNSVSKNTVHDVTGKTTAGATVTMTHPTTGATLTTTADAAGNYSFANLTFPRGTNLVTVNANDGLGHTATTSNTFMITDLGQDANIATSERTVFGNPIFIEVRDPETYMDPNKIDTLQVLVTNPRTGDSEIRTLVETGINTGVFRGQLNTVESAVSDGVNSGTLSVLYGDTVSTTYVDPIKSDGTLNATVLDVTQITNDGIKINVNLMSTDAAGSRETQALEGSHIAIMEFDANGQLTGNVYNYVTSGGGLIPAEFIGRMQRGNSYRVLINDPVNGYPYSQSQDFTLSDLENAPVDNRGVRTFILVLDPAGFVYDALTGTRVDGADVTFFHSDGTQVAGPFAVFTQNPSNTQTNPQLSGSSGVAGGFEFIGSSGGSDITAGFYYITVSYNTSPALGNTYLPVSLSSNSWAGIQDPYGGQVFRVDLQNQPIGMRIPLYRIGQQSPLIVTKATNKDRAAAGDIITFTLTVRNTSNAQTDPNNPVMLRDILPMGMNYVQGSAVLAGGTPVVVIEQSNGVLFFNSGILQAAGSPSGRDSATVYYQAAINTSTHPGMSLRNQVVATINQAELSNTAQVLVQVIADPLFDEATLIGRVYHDANRNGRFDKHEQGISGVGLILDDGTYVITDEQGKYSAPGARPGMPATGRRVVKLDTNTLAPAAVLTTPDSRFVILRSGSLDRANFGVAYANDAMAAQKPLCDADYVLGDSDNCKTGRLDLIAGMFDMALGTVDSGYGLSRPDLDIYPEGLFGRGRAALYYHTLRANKLDLTFAYDSEKRHTDDITTYKDKDLYYPTYGDNSSVRYLTQTQGKVFLKAKTRLFDVMAGNYTVNLSDTELASINRNLSGLRVEYDNRKTGRDGTDKYSHQFTVFTSRRGQLHGVTEIRSSGGAQYYLAHSDIVSGSETVVVEIRDKLIEDKVLNARTLTRDVDYSIDYYSGHVRLFVPVSMNADSNYLVNSGLGQGNPVWIVAEYAYDPHKEDYGALGARYYYKNYKGIGLGFTHLTENNLDRDHSLSAVDLDVFNKRSQILSLEYGTGRAGTLPRFVSHNSGRSFVQTGARNARSGDAFKLNFHTAPGPGLTWDTSYYDVDPDYSGDAYHYTGIRRYGSALTWKELTREFKLEYSNAVALSGADEQKQVVAGGGRDRIMLVSFKNKKQYSCVEAELLHEYTAGGASSALYNLQRGTTNRFSVRWERQITECISVQFSQQATLHATANNQTALGVRYRLNQSAMFTAQVVAGTQGIGGRLGFERTKNGTTTYVSVSNTYISQTGERATTTSAGISGDISNSTKAYIQYENQSLSDDAIRRKTIGLNHSVDAGDNLTMAFSVERSEEQSSVQGRYFSNAINWSANLTGSRQLRLSVDAQFRAQQGDIRKEYSGYHASLERVFLRDLTAFAEYAYDVSEDMRLGFADSKYTKALLGLAWRPAESDRINVLARAGRVREFRSLSANQALTPDAVARVFSLEGIYDFSNDIALRQKIASKAIRETVSPLSAARSHTTLWISGMTWRPSRLWDFNAEYRTMHQPTQRNHSNGLALEFGYTCQEKLRLGLGYNFSSYTDDAFHIQNHSFKGAFFEFSGKM